MEEEKGTKKPYYKQWWFIVIAVIGGLYIANDATLSLAFGILSFSGGLITLIIFTVDKRPKKIPLIFTSVGTAVLALIIFTPPLSDNSPVISKDAVGEAAKALSESEAEEIPEPNFDGIYEEGGGIILNISPNESKGWELTYVVLSDKWYDSGEYEKEQFVEVVGSVVKDSIYESGAVEQDRVIHVHFVDENRKRLASEKALGGYKIK